VITAVVLDNGHPDLEKCLDSLWNQTVPVDIIVVAGPNTDVELAQQYGKVTRPIKGYLNARIHGFRKASSEVILSCDSDTIYHPEYAEAALECLKNAGLVRAGTVIPKKETPLGKVEILIFYKLLRLPYDHVLAMRKSVADYLVKTVEFKYGREDIFTYVIKRAIPYKLCENMIAFVDVPTYHFRKLVDGDYTTVVEALSSLL